MVQFKGKLVQIQRGPATVMGVFFKLTLSQITYRYDDTRRYA